MRCKPHMRRSSAEAGKQKTCIVDIGAGPDQSKSGKDLALAKYQSSRRVYINMFHGNPLCGNTV